MREQETKADMSVKTGVRESHTGCSGIMEVDTCMSRASSVWKHARLTCEDQHKRESVHRRTESPSIQNGRAYGGAC